MFFEGTEKKFELILAAGSPSLRNQDGLWEKIISEAKTEALSKITSDKCDAYLLSESSLFVYDDRVIMITCGQTTLASAAAELLKEIDPKAVDFFFFERKNQLRPEQQKSSFYDDIQVLHSALPGKAFRFGEEDAHHIHIFHAGQETKPKEEDLTLEILMHGIHPDAARHFNKSDGKTLQTVLQDTQVGSVFDGFQVDHHLFDPIGYSLNAIKDESYYTFHVTPQNTGSYVSFETNHCSETNIAETIHIVTSIFQPSSFDIFFFNPKKETPKIEIDYQLRKEVVQTLDCGFSVHFRNYFKPQSQPENAEPIQL